MWRTGSPTCGVAGRGGYPQHGDVMTQRDQGHAAEAAGRADVPPGETPDGQGDTDPSHSSASSYSPSDPSEPRLTVAAVARRLGVAPATLRTWDRRYGLGPSDHTSGKHRRYGPRDVARLELMQRALLRGASPAEAARYALTAPLPSLRSGTGARPSGSEEHQEHQGDTHTEPDEPLLLAGTVESGKSGTGGGGRVLRLPGSSRRARGLGRAALAMDAAAALQLLNESITEEGVVATWDGVIRPVLCAVAERWEHSGVYVEVEHMLTECVTAALAQVLATAPPPLTARPVLLAGVPDEQHALPLRALNAALAQRGVGTRLLGTGLPAEALAAAVRRVAPSAIFLWAHLPRHADPELINGLPRMRQRMRIFAGGPGWDPVLLPLQVELLHGLGSAVDRIEQVVLGPERAVRATRRARPSAPLEGADESPPAEEREGTGEELSQEPDRSRQAGSR